jgi:myosin heavy subunit
LDISGFENLQANGFEQLFINITNEKIQQYYQGQIFERENQDYLHEGVDVSVFQYTSNADLLAFILKVKSINSLIDWCMHNCIYFLIAVIKNKI